jgi:hypothetical protein
MSKYKVHPRIHTTEHYDGDHEECERNESAVLGALRDLQRHGIIIDGERTGVVGDGVYAGSPVLTITGGRHVPEFLVGYLLPETLFVAVLSAPVPEPSLHDALGNVRAYLIFAIDAYEPEGGIGDLCASVNSMAEAFDTCYAIEAQATYKTKRKYQIVNSKTMRLMCKSEYDERYPEESWKWGN